MVDDGSTDDSREILQSYESHPTIKIILQENKGQEATLQRGFNEVTGDWVLGLDADDYYFPNCLEQISRFTIRMYLWFISRQESWNMTA